MNNKLKNNQLKKISTKILLELLRKLFTIGNSSRPEWSSKQSMEKPLISAYVVPCSGVSIFRMSQLRPKIVKVFNAQC